MKDAAGKTTGDRNLQADGKMDKAEGKLQKEVGKAKDTVRDAVGRRNRFRRRKTIVHRAEYWGRHYFVLWRAQSLPAAGRHFLGVSYGNE